MRGCASVRGLGFVQGLEARRLRAGDVTNLRLAPRYLHASAAQQKLADPRIPELVVYYSGSLPPLLQGPHLLLWSFRLLSLLDCHHGNRSVMSRDEYGACDRKRPGTGRSIGNLLLLFAMENDDSCCVQRGK